ALHRGGLEGAIPGGTIPRLARWGAAGTLAWLSSPDGSPPVRRLAVAAAFALLSAFGVAAPAAAATPTSTARVVIIVGATEGATATYRSYADQAYAEAIKYTSRVTKVYSPNATWTRVKAATAGAN